MKCNIVGIAKKCVTAVACAVLVVGLGANSVSAAPKGDKKPEDNGVKTVDLVIFAGQSNMSGGGGNAKAAPGVAHDCGFEYRNGKCPAGLYEVEEPFGITASGYTSDPEGIRNGTLVSAFMNTYYKSTGVPVVGISAARGGTAMALFWNNENVRQELVDKYLDAIAYCNANHIYVRNKYVVWLQGESDAIACVTAQTYEASVDALMAPLFMRGLDQVFIITIGNYAGLPGAYDEIVNAQLDLCATSPRFSLGSSVLHTLPAEVYTVDGVHYNQTALNMAGSEAATAAANFTKLRQQQ